MSASPAWDTEEGGDRGEATQEFGDFHLSYDDANSTSSRFIATVRCIDNDNEFDKIILSVIIRINENLFRYDISSPLDVKN